MELWIQAASRCWQLWVRPIQRWHPTVYLALARLKFATADGREAQKEEDAALLHFELLPPFAHRR